MPIKTYVMVIGAAIVALVSAITIVVADYVPSDNGTLYHEVHYALSMQGIRELRLYNRTLRGCAREHTVGIRMSGLRMSDGKYLEGVACGSNPRTVIVVTNTP